MTWSFGGLVYFAISYNYLGPLISEPSGVSKCPSSLEVENDLFCVRHIEVYRHLEFTGCEHVANLFSVDKQL